MKKKAFLSLFVAMLLSFSMMAKSNVKTVTTKLIHHRQSNQSAKLYGCVRFTTSCGVSGWACGETLGAVMVLVLLAEEIACNN